MFQLKVSNSDSFFLVTQIYATIKMGALPGLSTRKPYRNMADMLGKKENRKTGAGGWCAWLIN
jgi:hypothetical protein